MNVLMFGWEFPPFNSGGLGVACFGLSKALSQENVKVYFVLPKKMDIKVDFATILFADNNPASASDPLINGYITAQEYQKTAGLYPQRYGNSLIDEVLRYAILSRELVKNLNFDIIHAHDWLSFLAGIEAKKISGKPLIVHVHATEYDRSGGNINPTVYSIEKLGMEKADEVIAVSNFTKKLIIEKYGINPEKITVVHNGLEPLVKDDRQTHSDLLDGYKQKGFKIVLFVGRLTLQKGPDYFIKTAKKVLEYNPKVLFVMAGAGDMERQIIAQSVEYGISDNVIFTGFLRGEELERLYKAADLFVFPSVSEPFGLAPLESIANGTPVLISKQAGVGEVLTHALRADFWDVDDMTDKILSALEHPALLTTLSQNSLSELQDKSWKGVAQKMIGVYRNILSRFYHP